MVKVTDANDAAGTDPDLDPDLDPGLDFGAWYETPARNQAHWRFVGSGNFICRCPYLTTLDHPTTDPTLKHCPSCTAELLQLDIELSSVTIS